MDIFISDAEIELDTEHYRDGHYLFYDSLMYYVVKYSIKSKGYICRLLNYDL